MSQALRAYIGLGANLGDTQAALRSALSALDALPGSRLVAGSSLYRSAPIEASGPDYLNAVVALETTLGAPALLARLQSIEAAHGRERPWHNAPRSLDLDLLLYGNERIATPELAIPHPRLHQRAFVLRPLLEIDPALEAPGLGPLSTWLPAVADQRIERNAVRLDLRLRAFTEADFDTVVERWHTTHRTAYFYVEEQQRHTLTDARTFFREQLMPSAEITLACSLAGQPLGLLAIEPEARAGHGWVRQLAVFDGEQRRGVGSRLVGHAKARCPAGLRLYTFVRNAPARAFYAHHGFEVLAFGTSPAPESEPDVLYHWPEARTP
ncbi:MAG: 2-amino-4-hydroxy-6-hydroxymethyldihydropteridine diphosphokinase [Pseudomonadota bacterium]|jgi:2-amino-4-hydroxy-6-hydroxymethyldihydropteridine diphosphokinase